MKIIPKEDIITIVETIFPEGRLISQYDFEQIYEIYGDDYFISDIDHTRYSLCKKNEERKKICKGVN